MRRSLAWTALFLASLLASSPAIGQAILIDKDAAGAAEARRAFLIPYAFHSDVLDLAFGLAAGGRGIFQEQTAVVLFTNNPANPFIRRFCDRAAVIAHGGVYEFDKLQYAKAYFRNES